MKRPAASAHAGDKRSKPSNAAASSVMTRPMKEWHVEDVLDWLKTHAFQEDLCCIFEKNKIDGAVLVTLSEADLKQELGISALGDRRKLITKRDSYSNAFNTGLVAQSGRAGSAQLALTPATATQRTSNVKPELAPRLQKTIVSPSDTAGIPAFSAPTLASAVCPSLPDGPSKRQRLRVEILDGQALQAEFGYGGPVSNESHAADRSDNTDGAKNRIRKMLDMAFHAATPEAERAQALRNARRLMQQHAVHESDLKTEEKIAQGGLFAAKIVSIRRGTIRMEKWISELASSVNRIFDIACFSSQRHSSLFYSFYGRCDAAESAAYAFACAANLMLWMAGSRALPLDREFNFGTKHRGKKFSIVFRQDAGYVNWAKNTEYEGAGECLQNFIEYVRAQEDPAEWDRAYLEGMALTLSKKQMDDVEVGDALTLHSKSIQDEVLQHFHITLKSGRSNIAIAQGLRKARSSGSSDAAAVHLGQRQLQQSQCLAIKS